MHVPCLDTTPIANASDHDFKGDLTTLYLFQFGAYGTQYVYAWGNDGFDDALEEVAAWLADNAPGHFVTFEDSDYTEAADDIGAPSDWEEDDDWRDQVRERAEVDHTYTESGYLASWEWYVNDVTDPSVVAYIRWRSQEGADADEPYCWTDPDTADCSA